MLLDTCQSAWSGHINGTSARQLLSKSDADASPFILQIHYIANHIRCCGAGTAADTEFVTNLISSNIEVSYSPRL